MRTKWLEMQGKTVNGFKILEVYRENKRTIVKVVCPACGKIYTTRAETIKNGKDCGCTTRIKMNDLTGKKFGRLTAIEPTERKASNDSIIWADTPIRKMQEKQERKLKKKCSGNF